MEISRQDGSAVIDPEEGDKPVLPARDGARVAAKSGRSGRTIRFGVAFRLFAALLAITGFGFAAIVAALYAFSQYRQGFDRIASSSLPMLIAATDIAAQSQALAANAPNLAVVDSHFARQAVSQALHKQLKGLADVGERIKALAPRTEGLGRLFESQELLQHNLERLDRLVGDRIDADSPAANLMLRLRGLAARIHSASAAQLPIVVQGRSQDSVEAFLAWMAAADEAIAVMLSTSTADSVTRLNRLRADFDGLRGQARTALAQLPTLAPAFAPLEAALDQYGRATPNVFDARSAQLASVSAVRGALLETQEVSAEFVASAQSVVQDVQIYTLEQSNFFSGLISRYSKIFTTISILSLVGSAGVFFYIVRSIIFRLRKLSESMRARIDGRNVPIPTSGTDEIAEMATATQFFVTSIEQRERIIRERSAELAEALEYQTATSDVLNVISSSPTDIQPVLKAVGENAARLCDANNAVIFRLEGDLLRQVASYGQIPTTSHPRQGLPVNRDTVTGRAVFERQTIHVPDLAAEDSEFPEGSAYARRDGHRTTLATPLLREGVPLGAILIRRMEVRPFSDRQIELIETFADQAVIAIENTRLFEEVQARTHELTRSVAELKALGEVGQAVNSTIDLETVLSTIVAKAVQLSGTEAGTIYVFDEASQEFRLSASYGMDDTLIADVKGQPIRAGETVVGQAALQRTPVQIPDVQHDDSSSLVLDVILRAGFRALLTIPLLGANRVVGALVVRRKEPGEFPKKTVDLLQTFGAQSVLAIQNARLFHEIEEKGRQLEIASQHKSQFVANMSHELRTPLAAMLGYAELLQEGIYGALPEKSTPIIARMQSNGKHLLGLINTVLDIAKIEAGQFKLNLSEYALGSMVETVRVATESLAAGKNLALKTDVADGLPHGLGDEQRLTQVLLNLVGNAIKFTDAGEVRIMAGVADGHFTVAVRDTGPGIPAEERDKIFEEFHQIDSSNTKTKGGTGLGLAIAKQIVEMHGGRIWVESTLGHGATFSMELPVRAAAAGGTA